MKFKVEQENEELKLTGESQATFVTRKSQKNKNTFLGQSPAFSGIDLNF